MRLHCQNNFGLKDASFMFNLRTMMTNFVVDFDMTFAELAARPGVAEAWQAHFDVADRGDVPRQRWKHEASEAVALLRSAEFAGQQVVFICEAQMLLDDVYPIRTPRHEGRAAGGRMKGRWLGWCLVA
jgi:hypothetical protein